MIIFCYIEISGQQLEGKSCLMGRYSSQLLVESLPLGNVSI